MKRLFAIIYLLLVVAVAFGHNLKWSCGNQDLVTIEPASSTGLDNLFVIRDVAGVSVSFQTSDPGAVKWYIYSNLGGGYASEISDVITSSDASTITLLPSDMGYIVDSTEGRYCFWVTDYKNHWFTANSLNVSTESDCSETILDFDGDGSEIAYFTINGRKVVLDREISLTYLTLEPDETNQYFVEKSAVMTFPSVTSRIMAPSPLRSTSFTLEGDRFLKYFGGEVAVESPFVDPTAVSALCSAVQTGRDADNEVSTSTDALGGSAPCIIDFNASVSDGALFKEWQVSKYNDFDVIDLRFQDLAFSHTFTEQGTSYVRFTCANSTGNCEYFSEIFTISIGTSSLKCPNAFSPFNADGVNDEWKVSYSSIISFECHIFDRFGRKITSFSDPSIGWDGRYNGKFVPAGVYYYVIKARGADGKKYDLSGDINIVKYE